MSIEKAAERRQKQSKYIRSHNKQKILFSVNVNLTLINSVNPHNTLMGCFIKIHIL